MSLQIRNDPFTQRLQQIGQWIAQGLLQPAAQALTEAQAQHPKDVRVALMGVRLAQQAGNLCLLYTSDAADARISVVIGGRPLTKKTVTGEANAGAPEHATVRPSTLPALPALLLFTYI